MSKNNFSWFQQAEPGQNHRGQEQLDWSPKRDTSTAFK